MSRNIEAFGSRNGLRKVVIPYRPASPVEHLAEAKKKRRRVQLAAGRVACATLAAAGMVSAAGYATGSVDFGDISGAYERVSHKSLTDAQRKAAEVFASDILANGHLVSNVQIDGEELNGEKVAHLRNEPIAPNALDGIPGGDQLGDAEIGSIVPKALVVLGNNPDRKYQSDPKHNYWLGYPDPNNPNRFVFLSVNELDPGSRLAARAVEPLDLSKLP